MVKRSPPVRSSTPVDENPRFREHLSVVVPAESTYVPKSQFSPESPPVPPSKSSICSITKPFHQQNTESRTTTTTPGFRDRVARALFNMRTVSGKEPHLLPIQQPRGELNVEKRLLICPCPNCHVDQKRRKRKIWALIALIVILLFLLSDVIVLNIRVLSAQPPSAGPQSSRPSTTSPTTLSADTQQCISQYTLNAPANPSSYPCASCLPLLNGIPANFPFSNAQDGQTTQNAIQFCGLKAMFDSASPDGRSGLGNTGWLKDIRFCIWGGIACDSSGRISSISLTFPGVPSSIPNEIGSLQGLQNLQVIGNNAIPAGSLPPSFSNLTSLATLHLESTAITSIPDDLFTSLKSVKTLTLVKNNQMGPNWPSSFSQIPLQNIVINSQKLNNPLQSITTSTLLQTSLKFLDLTGTSITGPIPSTISSLTSLSELHLDSNALQPPLPSSLPTGLQILSLSGNPGLNGAVSGQICGMSGLKTCDLRGTNLTLPGGVTACGTCVFS